MFNRRDFLLHPTSMQSLATASTDGVSNPGLQSGRQSRQEDPVYCGLTEPIAPQPPPPQPPPQRQSLDRRHSSSHRHGGHSRGHQHRHHQRPDRACHRVARSCAKRVGCLRSSLLAAFVLILLGVIVTSSYAIDRRFSQIPQLLYTGLGLCSVGLFVIVVTVSLLVTRQLGKQQLQHQRQLQHQLPHLQRHEQQHQITSIIQSEARRPCSRRQQDSSGRGVPIWYIGCHRDAATAYYPPVPPSYWDSTAAGPDSSPKSPPPPPPPLQAHSRPQIPLPPPPPPSYQEALRCLEDRGSPNSLHQQQQHQQYRRQLHRQPFVGCSNSGTLNLHGNGWDQMSVLKWTVQSSQHLQQMHQRGSQNPRPAASSVRRCESSSFIGEPILV